MKHQILYIHHDLGNSGSTRSLSFLLDKIDTSRYTAKVHSIFGGQPLNVFKDKPVELLLGTGIYPFHGSTVTGMSVRIFLRNMVWLPSSLVAAYKLIRNNKPDLVHLNSSCLFVVALAAKLVSRKIKVVCHVREPLLRYSLSAAIIRLMNYLFVDYFIAIDSFSGSTMKTCKNMKVIHNAVNFEQYNTSVCSSIIREELCLSKDDVIFLYLARISKSNGALEFVKAAQKLTEAYPSFQFVVAGFKPNVVNSYARQVVSAAAHNDNIHLMKFRQDVPSLVADADVMVVPFTTPHFARSIVESSAIGKPTIGANIGGINELILHAKTGFLYSSEQELLDYCIQLGTNEALRKKMGKLAVDFAHDNFDNNVSSRRVFQVYQELLTPPATRVTAPQKFKARTTGQQMHSLTQK